MKTISCPSFEPFDIQSGFIYGDIPAVQVQLSEVTLIYRNVSNGVIAYWGHFAEFCIRLTPETLSGSI